MELGQPEDHRILRIHDGVVGDELQRLAGHERLLPGVHAAPLFPVRAFRLGLERGIHGDLVVHRHGRRLEEQKLHRHLVAARHGVERRHLPLGALADETGGAVAVLQALHAHLHAIIAAERQHQPLLRLRLPIGRADIAAVAIELDIAGNPHAFGEIRFRRHHGGRIAARHHADALLHRKLLMGERHGDLAAVSGEIDLAGHLELGRVLRLELSDRRYRLGRRRARRGEAVGPVPRLLGDEFGVRHAALERRTDDELPGGGIDDLRAARRTGRKAQAHAAPVLARALNDRRLALELDARGPGIERRAVLRPPAGVWHLVGGAQRARARGAVGDRHRAHIPGAVAHPREIALQGGDALVELALPDLRALDRAVGVGAAAANRLQHDGQRLGIERRAMPLLVLRPRAERGEIIAHELGGLHVHVERGLLVPQALDARLELGFARPERLDAARVLYRDFADLDAGVGLDAQRPRIEARRQAGELDSPGPGGDLRGALDHGAAGVKRDACDLLRKSAVAPGESADDGECGEAAARHGCALLGFLKRKPRRFGLAPGKIAAKKIAAAEPLGREVLRLFQGRIQGTARPAAGAPPAGLLGFYWHFVRQTKGWFAAMFAATLAVALPHTSIPLFTGRPVSPLEATDRLAALEAEWPLLVGMVALVLVVRPLVLLFDVAIRHNALIPGATSLIRWQSHWHVIRQSWP